MLLKAQLRATLTYWVSCLQLHKYSIVIFHAKLCTKVRGELCNISRDISLEERVIFPWTFIASPTNRVISLDRTWNFPRHSTIVQLPSCELLYVIDTFKWSCNLHKIYHCLLFERLHMIFAQSFNRKILFLFKLIVLNFKPLKLKTSNISPLFYLKASICIKI